MRILRTLVYLTFLVVSSGCNDSPSTVAGTSVEKILGIDLKKYNIDRVQVKTTQISPDYARPYVHHIAIGVDEENAKAVLNNLKLVKFDSTRVLWGDSLLCLYSNPVDLKLWDLEVFNHKEQVAKLEEQLSWWQPNTNSSANSFASYYRVISNERGKIVTCNTEHDGRIVGQYVAPRQTLYILVEIFP